MVTGELDTYMQEKEPGSLSYTVENKVTQVLG